mgnify:CR=1 FL=1
MVGCVCGGGGVCALHSATAVPVTLGCESGESGEIYRQKADGILGMGNNPGTFHGEVRVFVVVGGGVLRTTPDNATAVPVWV